MDKLKLMKTANEIRKGIVSSVHSAKAGHPGGSLSAADIFTYLYFEELNIDPKNIVFKRAMDMNDRALRQITVAQGKKNGIEREDGFVITVASELMAIMCISKDENDFKQRAGDIIVAYTYDNKPITVRDLKIVNAVMKLMREA